MHGKLEVSKDMDQWRESSNIMRFAHVNAANMKTGYVFLRRGLALRRRGLSFGKRGLRKLPAGGTVSGDPIGNWQKPRKEPIKDTGPAP